MRSRDRRVHVRHGLRGFHLAECLLRGHVGADIGDVHVDDVAERILRVVGDADAQSPVTLVPHPFMLRRVPQVVGDSIGSSV